MPFRFNNNNNTKNALLVHVFVAPMATLVNTCVMKFLLSKLLRVCVALLAILLWFAPMSHAQDVTLSTKDNRLIIKGKILFFNDEYIRLQTPQGQITLHAEGMICEGHNCPKPEQRVAKIGFAGAGKFVADYIPELVKNTADLNDVAIKIVADKTETTIAPSTQDLPTLNIAVSNHSLTIEQQKSVRQPTLYLGQKPDDIGAFRRSVIATDGLVPIVHLDNPIQSIALSDLRKILNGDITNWKQIGGVDQPILLHLHEQVFQSPDDWPKMLADAIPDQSQPNIMALKTINEIETQVSNLETALGIIPYSQLKNARDLPIRTACNLMFHADYFAIKSGEYPLSYNYHLYRPAKRLPRSARNFLDNIYAPISQSILEKQGFLSLWPAARSFSYQGDRLAYALQNISTREGLEYLQDMVRLLSGARRLSITFRFDETGRRLDRRSTAQVRILRQAINSGVYDDQQLIFAGFADNRGDHAGNQKLSLERANHVLRQVFKNTLIEDLDPNRVAEAAFGEIAPVACNETEYGQSLNRRVELWVRDQPE